MLKFVIFTSDKNVFEFNRNALMKLGVSAEAIILADSNAETRLDALKKYPRSWLFFLDHDCLLNIEQLQKLNQIYEKHKNRSRNFIVAGKYTDVAGMGVVQKTHNWIANTWLESSYQNKEIHPMFLGGVFLIYWEGNEISKDLGVGVWGAEDKYSALVLKKAGFEFVYDPDLSVEHKTSPSLKHFIRRAFLHGVNDVKYFSEERPSVSFLGWIRKIDFSNVGLVFLVLLHFSVQKAAKIFQIIRQ